MPSPSSVSVACACFQPGCKLCKVKMARPQKRPKSPASFGAAVGSEAVGPLEGAPSPSGSLACACFLPDCNICNAKAVRPLKQPKSSTSSGAAVGSEAVRPVEGAPSPSGSLVCACFLPDCNICNAKAVRILKQPKSSSSSESAVGSEAVGPVEGASSPSGSLVCTCFLPDCNICNAKAVRPLKQPKSSSSSGAAVGSEPFGPAKSMDSCFCYLPDCDLCNAISRPGVAATGTGLLGREVLTPVAVAVVGKKKDVPAKTRKQMVQRKPGSKRNLDVDVAEDQAAAVDFVAEHAALLESVPSSVHQSALCSLGFQDGERWLFLEVFAGCGHLTAAVTQKVAKLNLSTERYKIGPAVDWSATKAAKSVEMATVEVATDKAVAVEEATAVQISRLNLDLTRPFSQTLLLQLISETEPFWIHVAPPCTYWTPMSRFTATRTLKDWLDLGLEQKNLLNFGLHITWLQHTKQRRATFEQPPRCASWRLQRMQFLQKHFKYYKFPSCSFGMRDPESHKPVQKLQALLGNFSLKAMLRPCSCPVPPRVQHTAPSGRRRSRSKWIRPKHGHLQGSFRSGPFKGMRRTAWAGRYPRKMCEALAGIALENFR